MQQIEKAIISSNVRFCAVALVASNVLECTFKINRVGLKFAANKEFL